ncbi:bifunctional 2-polyprenyl-6-hydroxyphenol methylase/3-demethylubiquinol 3-O-methyltransferase UbiG [Pigmentibacter sp. JX0631]|uniref:bifunctional 2-polyprenyl-6-hydroxyphenol methylase/3-demethylubiquinol 3-O-methyltransferase UbiG n=1 Tax=Pigmentibacter sp. JX0631 TaxID=2976982 RepID=UPI002469774F|nr:bifunctional 2-polyprenyl-6-hydroxyphenol methylase/3-demethylubiquinol 3-O-methyltransferase UbiG [Pigmentibacter sp. JX0631]WGL58493.1 bifunctional 2-polyprenyl-6-hydroxyphenol methylase/3-demethylubiquinol 3-O-methyltransferase UbiG [Pigmentibacter sp. JX0631]
MEKYLINNEIYKDLNEQWYTGKNYVALLRSEAKLRNPWIKLQIEQNFADLKNCKILDIGCGGGLLANDLAELSNNVTGVDIFEESLVVARKYNKYKNVNYIKANALELPFANETFDVVCILDVLEHVDDYQKAIAEAVRVVKKNGFIFFHTFNRNLFTKYFVIKAMEWFVKETPKNLHVHHLFIKPCELTFEFNKLSCKLLEIKGLNPSFNFKNIVKLIFKKEVDENFNFKFSKFLHAGYIGYCQKLGN